MKAFDIVQVIGTLITIVLAVVVWGLPLAPGIILFDEAVAFSASEGVLVRAIILGLAISSGLLLWGIGLLLFSGILQFAIHPRIDKEMTYPLASFMTIRWAITGLLHRLTCPMLQHLVPSFIANWYYRICGCKLGMGAQINSQVVNDAYAVKIGADSVIGGNAIINCHLVEDGKLVLAPVTIGERVTIGGGSSILPGSVIGDDVIIAYNAVVTKRTTIPNGEVWGGLPAKKIR